MGETDDAGRVGEGSGGDGAGCAVGEALVRVEGESEGRGAHRPTTRAGRAEVASGLAGVQPTNAQRVLAESIVAGGVSTSSIESLPDLRRYSMRVALREAISAALAERNLGSPDQAASKTLVEGLEATKLVGNGLQEHPDYAVRKTYLDRLLFLLGDLERTDASESGESWDELILRMRRPAS